MNLMNSITPVEIAAGAVERRLDDLARTVKQLATLLKNVDSRLRRLEDYDGGNSHR